MPRSANEIVCYELDALSYTDKEVLMSQQARANYLPYNDL